MENKVIYQIYPKSFHDTNNDGYGDIRGIINKFEHIVNLNVDYIWLTPVLKSPQNDNGYDISDYEQIDSIFGTIEDYKELIRLAKEHNIKVMLDLVLNHVSTDHIWFKKALNGDAYYQDFFVWTNEPNELKSGFGMSAWTYSPAVGKYYLHLFDVSQADLNWHNPNVRENLFEMVNKWIDIGVEGFRLDVIDLIAKEPEKMITSRGPKFNEYLSELVEKTNLNNYLSVGECWNFGPENTVDITGENGLTQVFHFSHLDWIYPKWNTPRISKEQLCSIFNKWQKNDDVIEALVLNNHDLPRLQSYWYGESKNQLDNYYKCTMLFALNLLSRGNTYIYQGEEVGIENCYNFTLDDYNDVESRNKINELRAQGVSDHEILKLLHTVSRDNARSPIKWNNGHNFGFSTVKPWLKYNDSPFNVKDDVENEYSIYHTYSYLNKWKKDNYHNFGEYYNAKVIDEIVIIENDKYMMYINFDDHDKTINITNQTFIYSNYQSKSSSLRAYESLLVEK